MDSNLSPKMIEMLMDCHEREILGLEPCDSHNTQTGKGLIARGFFTSEMYTSKTSGKKYMAFFVTESGRQFLRDYTRID